MAILSKPALAGSVAIVIAATTLGQAPDTIGGHATTHVLVCVKPGVSPAVRADGGVTLTVGGVAPGALSHDAVGDTLQRWQVSAAKLVFESGFADPVRAAELGLDRTYRLETPQGTDTPALAAELATFDNLVERAEVDGVGGIAGEGGGGPNDQWFNMQWPLLNFGQSVQSLPGVAGADVNAIAAWQITTGSPSIVIAVLDAGMDPHEELAARTIPGINVAASPDNGDTGDVCISHGTHVAGIAGASANNEIGIAGVDWGSTIVPIRVLNSCSGVESVLGEGLVWAADQGVDVANMSLQYYTGTSTLHNAIIYARDAGVVLIAAAGNSHGCPAPPSSTVAYPAKWPETIAVGATNNSDLRYGSSNCGNEIDVSAPGQSVWSLRDTTDYQYLSGTSMATPHVSGTATLMLALDSALTADEIRQTLQNSAEDLFPEGPDHEFGAGRIDTFEALKDVLIPGDVDANGVVDTLDFLALLAAWGPCPSPCLADTNDDGIVDTLDFLELLGNWTR